MIASLKNLSYNQKRFLISITLFITIMCLLGIPYTHWWFQGQDDFHGLYLGYKTKTWKDLFYFFYEGHTNQGIGPSNGLALERTTFFTTYYRPLYCIYLSLQFWLFGTNAYAYFLCNVFFHALNTVILFTIFSWLIPLLPAVLTAFLFAFHPQIAYRFGDIVNLHFYINVMLILLIMLCFKKYLDSKKIIYYVLASLLFVLALFTRESSIVLPIMLCAGTYLYKKINARPTCLADLCAACPSKPPGPFDKTQDKLRREALAKVEATFGARPEEPAVALAKAGRLEGYERSNQFFQNWWQAFKLTLNFWIILSSFFALRIYLYPIKFASSAKPLLIVLKNKLIANLSVLLTFAYDFFGISWLPWGNKLIRSSALVSLSCLLIWLFIKNKQKIWVLYFFACAALMLWPAYTGYYPGRYFYETYPFILVAFILCFKYYHYSLHNIKKVGILSWCLLIFFYATLCVESFARREKKMHTLAQATYNLIQDPRIKNRGIQNRALCFLGHPFDGCGDQNAPIFWILLNDPTIPIYFDSATALRQIDADSITPTRWKNSIGNYHTQNFFTITKVPDGFNFISLDPNKIQFALDRSLYSLGKKIINKTEIIKNQKVVTDFTLIIDEKYLNQDLLFITWDYKNKKFKFI